MVNKRNRLKKELHVKIRKESRKMYQLEKNVLLPMLAKEKAKAETKEVKAVEKVKPKNYKGRAYTISVAVPGSIMDNAQSPELRSYLAGQIARACVIFHVDEIVVYDDYGSGSIPQTTEGSYSGVGRKGNASIQLARILQYMECPQYLRKRFFPKHPDLQYAGLLNPLDSPHHMRKDKYMPFREGVVLDKPVRPDEGSFVDCGIAKSVQIDKKLEPNLRVTVKMIKKEAKKRCRGTVVSPDTPRVERGLYWGYTVRLASSLSNAIADCAFKGADKYDLTIGTSEHGDPVDTFAFPSFKHALIVFGSLRGLESALENDEALNDVDDPRLLFDHYLNTCPNQGSRTIRTEEAILITMSGLRPKIPVQTQTNTTTSESVNVS